MYNAKDKMAELMNADAETLQIISRFGLPLGVGDQTVDEVCQAHHIHTETLLSVVNHIKNEIIDIPTLMIYLSNAHKYFLEYQLPRIRQTLIEAVSSIKTGSQVPLLIIRLYDEYVEEVKTHIAHENENNFQQHQDDDQHVAAKLKELKNIIIRFYPAEEPNNLLYAALQDIFQIEKELALHCSIEDDILLPALSQVKKESDQLTDREKDVLVQVVKGMSNKEIADVLNISTHTVISHRKNIVRKLNIHSAAGLTIYAIVNKLVCLDALRNS